MFCTDKNWFKKDPLLTLYKSNRMKSKSFFLKSCILILVLILSSCEKKNHPPVIENQTFTIDENSEAGTLAGQVLGPVQTLKYSIVSGNTNNAFDISEADGKITVHNADAIDYETTPKFTLVIQGKDENNETGHANITINLNNLDMPTAGLLLYMPFDGNVNDLSLYNNNGIDYTSHNYVAGKKSQALDFNGTSDFIRLTYSINSQNGLSFSFWVYTRGANGSENNGSIISKYSKINNTRCFMVYSFGSGTVRNDNRLSAAFYSDGSTSTYYHDMTKSYLEPAELLVYPDPALWTITNPTRLVSGEWTHCVVNVTPTSIETWINGKFCTRKTREYSSYFNSNAEPVLIGNNYDCGDGTNNHFNGILDELRVYNRGLTNKEITTLYKE
jgi:Concanavalin A-like lectin/glucanases superfamily/Cadherin domain